MSGDVLLIEKPTTGVTLLTLNRPEALNSLTMDLQRQVDEQLTIAAEDEDVRCVVVTGAGRAFCAGNDIPELVAMTPDELMLSEVDREEWHWRFATCKKPVIVAMNGLAVGAGGIIATSADIRIGCPATTIKYGSAQYGGLHCTWNLPAIVGLGKAKELLYTSRNLEAEECLAIGLLNKLVPNDKVVEAAVEMGAKIASNTKAVQRIKEAVTANIGLSWEDQYRRENRILKSMIKGSNGTPAAFAPFMRKEHKSAAE